MGGSNLCGIRNKALYRLMRTVAEQLLIEICLLPSVESPHAYGDAFG